MKNSSPKIVKYANKRVDADFPKIAYITQFLNAMFQQNAFFSVIILLSLNTFGLAANHLPLTKGENGK